MSSKTPDRIQAKRNRWVFAIAAVGAMALIAIVLWAKYTFQDYSFHPGAGIGRDTSIRAKGGIKGDSLEVHWPARPTPRGVLPAITLRIPRPYVHEGTTWVDEEGRITSVAIIFELPGPIPRQGHPRAKGKEPASEDEKPKKPWFGRHSMDIAPGGGTAYESRMYERNKVQNAKEYLRDTDVAGLERYSSLQCHTPEELKNPVMKRFLDEKPIDDPSPSHCRLNRFNSRLISPPEVKNNDEGVEMWCSSGNCYVRFSVLWLSVKMTIRHKDIPHWKEIVEPARQLVRSFSITPASAAP